MTITLGDATIPIVDAQLCLLVAANLSAMIDRFALGVEVACRSFSTIALDVPAATFMWHHMVVVQAARSYHI